MSSIQTLTWLRDDDRLTEIIRKLSLGTDLSDDESVYCLAVAIFFIKTYQSDKRRGSYLEFGYFLILSYSLLMEDFQPLYDLTTNLGFYPITKSLINYGMVDSSTLNGHFIDKKLEKFSYKEITETLEQQVNRTDILHTEAIDCCYVAPTSFGKSSLMVDLINCTSSDLI